MQLFTNLDSTGIEPFTRTYSHKLYSLLVLILDAIHDAILVPLDEELAVFIDNLTRKSSSPFPLLLDDLLDT